MDTKRLIAFIVLSFGILLLWQEYFAPKHAPTPVAQTSSATTSASGASSSTAATTTEASASSLVKGQRIVVETDTVRAEIDTAGGDVRQLELLKQGAVEDPKKPFLMFQDSGDRTYIAQSGLLSALMPELPNHKTVYRAAQTAYRLADGQNSLEVKLTAPAVNGVAVDKIYTFSRGGYLINVRYTVANQSGRALPLSAYFRFLRDGKAPEGENRMAYTFTGPAVYTEAGKFQKIKFEDLDKGKAEFVKQADNGWVGMLQHYFASAWLLKPHEGKGACASLEACHFEVKPVSGGLYSAGVIVDQAPLAAGETRSFEVPLFAGPEETHLLERTATGLELTKDYGWVTIIASPLFWLLSKFHGMVGNWGWAIILLTVLIKAIFYPLSAASYRSMAKMKALAPRLERLKAQHGDDRMKFQQAVMEMYKVEKVNPLGGCLPIVIQIPVFIGLYWALLASVELRQAPWLGWIHDLSRPDPFYILPILMAVSMFAQTFLNPPPADPIQAKMMKIMPLVFSVMFFFFPAGLVLYWVVNNILSMSQQWYINQSIERAAAAQKNS